MGIEVWSSFKRHRLPRIVWEAVPNVVRHPEALWHVGNLARAADLSAELAELRRRRYAVTLAWSEQDSVIPESAGESLRLALGQPRYVTVPGQHTWLIDDPQAFADLVVEDLDRAGAQRRVA